MILGTCLLQIYSLHKTLRLYRFCLVCFWLNLNLVVNYFGCLFSREIFVTLEMKTLSLLLSFIFVSFCLH